MKNILKGWDPLRIIRLIIAIFCGVYAVVSKDHMFIFLALFFLVQAIFNISCCGAGGCSTGNSQKQVYKDVIKPYKPKENKD